MAITSFSCLRRLLMPVAILIGCSLVGRAAHAQLVINEVEYDQPGTDGGEFIELKNVGSTPLNLGSYSMVLVNGNGGGAATYLTFPLPGVILGAGQYYVICGNAANVPNCNLDVTPNTDFIQNGSPDAMALMLSARATGGPPELRRRRPRIHRRHRGAR